MRIKMRNLHFVLRFALLNLRLINMNMNKLLENAKGKKTMLLGNEAIIRGALEAGVQFVSTYPGTPRRRSATIFLPCRKN